MFGDKLHYRECGCKGAFVFHGTDALAEYETLQNIVALPRIIVMCKRIKLSTCDGMVHVSVLPE